jgi:hypothetical protein
MHWKRVAPVVVNEKILLNFLEMIQYPLLNVQAFYTPWHMIRWYWEKYSLFSKVAKTLGGIPQKVASVLGPL